MKAGYFYLFIIYLLGHVMPYLWHAGSNSQIRDSTLIPCIGSMESQPLDYQGSPCPVTSWTLSQGISCQLSSNLWFFLCLACFLRLTNITFLVLMEFRFSISAAATAAAKSLQSCLTLCDPRDGSPPGSPIPGILQARTLEWVAISFSNAGK